MIKLFEDLTPAPKSISRIFFFPPTVKQQYPIDEFQFMEPSLRLNYADGVKMLNEAGVAMADDEDLTYVSLYIPGTPC